MDLSHEGVRLCDEVAGVELLVRIPDVKKMMGQLLSCLSVRLCGPNIHAAVHLHGVGIDDLSCPAEKIDQQLGLADRGRPEEQDYRRASSVRIGLRGGTQPSL